MLTALQKLQGFSVSVEILVSNASRWCTRQKYYNHPGQQIHRLTVQQFEFTILSHQIYISSNIISLQSLLSPFFILPNLSTIFLHLTVVMSTHPTDNKVRNAFTHHPPAVIDRVCTLKSLGFRTVY